MSRQTAKPILAVASGRAGQLPIRPDSRQYPHTNMPPTDKHKTQKNTLFGVLCTLFIAPTFAAKNRDDDGHNTGI